MRAPTLSDMYACAIMQRKAVCSKWKRAQLEPGLPSRRLQEVGFRREMSVDELEIQNMAGSVASEWLRRTRALQV